MKILSIRKGFQSDHSSTSYEFFAIDKPLNISGRKDVARLSSRARPTRRRVSFIYHGEWNDIPGGWKPLIRKYYDVMYSESYSWWTLAMAFEADQKTIVEIKKYEFRGIDDMGIDINSVGNRVIITIFCRFQSGSIFGEDYSFYEIYDYKEGDEEEDDELEAPVESDDSLLNLLANNRGYLKNGDYRLLYGVWKKLGLETEENEEFGDETPPEPPGMPELPHTIEYLLSLMEKER